MDIKEMLIKIREKNNYTKKEVSEKTGIPYTTYIKYESGERKDVSMQALCKLADFYHVTTDYLLGREEKEGMTADDNRFEEELLEIYRSMPEEYRKLLYDNIRAAVLRNRGDVTEEINEEIGTVIEMVTKKYSCLLTSAGAGEWLDDENFEEREFPATPEAIAADIIIPVKGDSMEPEISDGDKLCVKLCDDIEVGEIGVFILNGNGYVKKRRDGYWESVNPEYDDIYVSKTDTYKFVGRVIGKAELPE